MIKIDGLKKSAGYNGLMGKVDAFLKNS